MAATGKHGRGNAMPDQISKSASAYQAYGEPTARSQAYSQWAGETPKREFDMTAGKRAARRRVAFIIFVILVIVAVVAFVVTRVL